MCLAYYDFLYLVPLVHEFLNFIANFPKFFLGSIFNLIFSFMKISCWCFMFLFLSSIFFFIFVFLKIYVFIFFSNWLILFFKFNFIFKLYNIVLVFPNIKMNPPQVFILTPKPFHIRVQPINNVVVVSGEHMKLFRFFCNLFSQLFMLRSSFLNLK